MASPLFEAFAGMVGQQVRAIQAEADATKLREMIRFLLNELENRDGHSPSIASCPECTSGTVPDSQNKGPCLYHQALKLFA
jgi:hypothetical protein